MKFADLSMIELLEYTLSINDESIDSIFLESLIRFLEFNKHRTDKRILMLFPDDAQIIKHAINYYIIESLLSENSDIRLFNIILKYESSKFFFKYRSDYEIIKRRYMNENF
jgi:hypothetical protein